MAVVAVTANNTRLDDAEANTGWAGIGGGQAPSAEGSFPYQGNNLVNKKITATGGVYYDPTGDGGAAEDVTAAASAHWMVKAIVTDYGGLNATMGAAARVGSGTAAYNQICIAGTDAAKAAYDTYTARGGLLIIPVNPNISGYRTQQGSPTLTAADYFAFYVDLDTGSAKSENVGLDAIDLGTGLTLVGGDGVSADGVWSDFTDADEGVVLNRWGYASTIYNGAVLTFFGQMTIGSATATEFSDSTASILWPDGFFAAGVSRVFADLQNASTIIHDGATHTSLGTTDVEDTRADFVWDGTAGTGTASHSLSNFRNYVMTSAVDLDGAYIELVDLTMGGGTISNSEIGCGAASGVAVCNDAVAADLDNVVFTQQGSGHAIEITSPGTYDFQDLFFNGFGGTLGSNPTANSGANDAAIYNNSGGAVTINVLGGGTSVSVRNGAGASTTVVTGLVTVLVTVLDDATGLPLPTAHVRLMKDSDKSVLINAAANASGQVSTQLSYADDLGSTDTDVVGWCREWDLAGDDYTPQDISGTITDTGFAITVRLRPI